MANGYTALLYIMCPTFRANCQELDLLENDTHLDMTIAEAIISAVSY